MNPRQEFEDRLAATLAELREAGLLRQMRLADGIDLVSNDYLGLADHPELTGAMRAALLDLSAGSGGSRLLRGHHEIFEIIEARLAAFSRSEAALLFDRNAATLVAASGRIARRPRRVDAHNHASLIDGIRLTRLGHTHLSDQESRRAVRRAAQPRQGARS